ncbi:hypothetical protein PoB_000025400 [Plakobranchus ocellatus]|uniref:Uncharacterized protein n=1 Tax=Plakobranchus ocellatus TaxID=259542 RepID=A0AAV3XVF4_9GAST|nr:hypothetical protein PoB_000025400 [Plakobranchus ocellatus]
MTKATLTLRSPMLNCAVALNVPCGYTQKLATLSVQYLMRDNCSSSVKALMVIDNLVFWTSEEGPTLRPSVEVPCTMV